MIEESEGRKEEVFEYRATMHLSCIIFNERRRYNNFRDFFFSFFFSFFSKRNLEFCVRASSSEGVAVTSSLQDSRGLVTSMRAQAMDLRVNW